MISIETARLIIRDHIPEDIFAMHQLYSSSDEMRYLPNIKTSNLEETKRRLNEAITENNIYYRTKYFYAILDKNAGYIGEIGYTIEAHSDIGDTADFGFFINQSSWNSGYVTEAGKSVIGDAFLNRKIIEFTASCLKENVASERVLLKLGFRQDLKYKGQTFHENQWKDRVLYRLPKTLL